MDRISALRNVEEALTAFEAGQIDQRRLEERVAGALRTYVSELDADAPGADGVPYRVAVPDRDRPLVVVAANDAEARERAGAIAGVPAAELSATRVE